MHNGGLKSSTFLYMCFSEHKSHIEEIVLEHPVMNSDLSDPSNGVTALKHIRQQVYIHVQCIMYINYGSILNAKPFWTLHITHWTLALQKCTCT